MSSRASSWACRGADLGGRSDPEFVGQRQSVGVVHAQRLRPPAGRRQRLHQQQSRSLAQRLSGNECLEIADGLGTSSQRDERSEPLLERSGADLGESLDLDEPVVGLVEIRIWPTTPPAQRLVQLGERRSMVGGRGRRRLRDARLESQRIECVVVARQYR
jgi:hypothetical protein